MHSPADDSKILNNIKTLADLSIKTSVKQKKKPVTPDTADYMGIADLPETGSMNTEVISGPLQETAEFSNPDTALAFIKQLVSQKVMFTVTYVPKRSNQ